MALFWSVVAGEVDQQVEVPTTSVGSVRMVALEVSSGTTLEDGIMEGQLLMWTFEEPARWVPVPNTGGAVAAAWGLKNTNDADPCQLFLGDGTVSIAGLTAQMNSRSGNLIMRVTDDAGEGASEWQCSFSDGVTLTRIVGTSQTIHYDASLHTFRNPNVANDMIQNVVFGISGDDPQLGVLGAAPASRQSITGATTQDQVDSLVAALVAFGFVTDDR